MPPYLTPVAVFVSPLATLAFKLCAVGDTGLKAGWVRCRHGAEGIWAGWGRVGIKWYKCCSLAPEIPSLSVSVCVCSHFYSCALQLHLLHREVHSENVFYANICTKNVHLMAYVRFYGAYGVCVIRVASFLNSGIYCATNKFRS